MIAENETLFAQVVADKAMSNPDFNVLTFVSITDAGGYSDERRSYKTLYDNGQNLAYALAGNGLGQGDNFALMMNNHPEFVEAMVASGIVGASFVPIDARTMGEKLSYMLDFTDCKGVVCADYCVESVLSVARQCQKLEWLIIVPTGLAPLPVQTHLAVVYYHDMLAAPCDPVAIVAQSLDEPMFMMFTSGTTGNPKAVINSHRKYMALATSMGRLGLNDADVFYTGLSLTHVNAQNTLRNAVALERPAVISRKFTKSKLWDICRHYRCTIFSLLGGMIPEIYGVSPQKSDADNPVRIVFSSGMPAHIWEDFTKRFAVVLCEGYGSTEGGGLSNPMGMGPVGSIGKPSAEWQAEILDEAGNICSADTEGEICFRLLDGTPVAVDYYKNPEASSNKVRNGWLHMGDLGHKDENGWFFFHHRIGGGVRKNGDFVNTTLVESVLIQSPLVDDVFIYGVPTAKNVAGEKTLVAAVVAKDGGAYSHAALLAYCATKLECNDIPEIVQLLAAIPKTISEKPIEKACIELLRDAALI